MITTPEAKAAAEKMIEEFVAGFHNRFGISPIVVYDVGIEKYSYLTLQMLEDVCNENLRVYEDGVFANEEIRTKSRKRGIVIHRQVFYCIARNHNYQLVTIGKHLGFDHASVLHGARLIETLLNNKTGGEVSYIYNRVMTLLQIKKKENEQKGHSNPGILPRHDDSKQADTKPILPSVLYSGGNSDTTN